MYENTENSQLKYTVNLEARDTESWSSELPCGWVEIGDREVAVYCFYTDTCMSSGTQKKCRRCNTDRCDGIGEFDPPNPFPYPKKFKAMFVGDSLTQGANSDVTWRYRMWEWIKDSNEWETDFVGPWKGTFPIPDRFYAYPKPPPMQGDPDTGDDRETQGGLYHRGVPSGFPDRHYSRWGRQAAQSKGDIAKQVRDYQPTHLLVMLGFNDIGWWVSDAAGMVSDLSTLVYEAQTAKNDIKILVANIPHRTDLGWRDDLIENTNKANQLIADNIARWGRFDSVVKMVDVESFYNCGVDSCPGGVSRALMSNS